MSAMKSFVLAIIVISVFGIEPIAAQNSSAVVKGVRAGWHYAGMYRSGNQIYDPLNSFYVGFFSESNGSGIINGGSGLEYFQNGFENSNGNFRMHTLSIPFYIKPQIGPVYATGGFSLNFKLADNREDFSTVSDPKFFDIPLHLGLGLQLGPIRGEVKYFWGLFDAANIQGRAYKHQYLQAGLGLSF